MTVLVVEVPASLLVPLQFLTRQPSAGSAVRVIDSQASDDPHPYQLENKAVCFLKDNRVLCPNRGQLIDVEEPTIIDFIRRHPPEAKPVGLIGQQAFQLVETRRIPFAAVDHCHCAGDPLAYSRAVLGKGCKTPFDNLLFALAFANSIIIHLGP